MQKKKFKVIVSFEECKGCERCVNACPRSVLIMGSHLNHMGFPAAQYKGAGCIGCGSCFYTCPEPGAITIIRLADTGGEQ